MNDDTLIVTETEGDTFDLQLSESSMPETFRRRAASLTGSGLSESEARHVVATTPVPMELFCDSERGIFAVEAEPLAYTAVQSLHGRGDPEREPPNGGCETFRQPNRDGKR